MATLGACAAVRDSLSEAGAMFALVSTGRIRSAMQTCGDALAELVLSPRERERFAGAPSLKRRIEFLGGRLAAKSVCLSIRGDDDVLLPPFAGLEVRSDAGAPFCLWPDGFSQRVSIAHCGAFAIAMCAAGDGTCGVDIEPVSRTLDPALDGYFHSIERLQITCDSDARLCWTVREAWGKLTARGVAADLDRQASVRAAGAWWLAAPRPFACPAVVGAGENERLAIAVAIRRDGSR